MTLHVQGMGVVGSGIAWELSRRNVDFTWSDIDSNITAWRASTGTIYPSPEPRDEVGYKLWANRFDLPELDGLIEMADYWYCTKAAPHGYKGQPTEVVGSLKRHPLPSFHLNVQDYVRRTRSRFANLRVDAMVAHQYRNVIVAHGFNERLRRYVWGWTRAVKLRFSSQVVGHSLRRPCVYLRRGRFVMAYAYPIPGTDCWYAGSTLLHQPIAKERDPQRDYDRWKANFEELSEGIITVGEEVGPLVQGWRPSTGPTSGEAGESFWNWSPDRITVMPMWHSGVRWLPSVVAELMGILRV